MSRLVKCKYCGEYFDRDKEEWDKVGTRYAHSHCIQDNLKKLEQRKREEELERQNNINQYHEVLDFAKTNIVNPNYALIQKQIRSFIDNNGYTYSGIYKTLIYCKNIAKLNFSNGNGGIGIVPYVYKDAFNYYYSIWEASQKNEGKVVEEYKPVDKVVRISPPQRKLKKRQLFTFLDEEE